MPSISTLKTSPINKLDREQRDYILAQLRALREKPRFAYRSHRRDKRAMSPTVRRADRVVARFEKQKARESAQRERAYDRAKARIEREMLFGSMTRALAMLDKEMRS